MNRYACIISGVVSYLLTSNTQPVDIPHKNVIFLPCPTTVFPTYDPTTQKVVGPTYVIQATSVDEVYSVVDLNASELDAVKTLEISQADKVALKVLFNHENRIRVLEGKSTITAATFLTALKNLL